MSAVTASPPAVAANPAPRTPDEVIADLQHTVSSSRLSLFLQCRLRFFYRYVVALPKPKTPALHVGNTVHGVLKAWHKARWLGAPLSLKQLHDTCDALWKDQEAQPVDWSGEDEEAEKLTAWRLCETYLRQCGIEPGEKPDAVEVSIETDLAHRGLPRIIGILDLVQQGRIIDYKTASSTPNPEKVAHTHEIQTSIYALLYRHNTGHIENGIELHHLVKLKNPKLCITELPPMSAEQQTRLFRLIEAYQQGLGRKDFVPSPGLACMNCEFFNECRQWK
jgi:CRISPR/Cas system-associated exonuclease Cas4 (RecB family)